ncbi:MAG: type IV toxin-antitoxin system AbiEi family antitoxin domain-containing protein [Candidatus Brocadiia bacterium]
MSEANSTYGGVGIELVRRLSAEGERVFTTARARELAADIGISESYFRQVLHHLARSGWLVRLRKGLYGISPTVPGVTPAHEFEIAMHLVDPAAISHWSALNYHGLTDQVPGRVFVLTTADASAPRERGDRSHGTEDGYVAGEVTYRFIQVKRERFFGTEKVWVADARVTITDLERTLIDGLTMPQHCGDIAEVLAAFENAVDRLDVDRITDYALRLDQATAKRLGWVLEQTGMEHEALGRLLDLPISGYRTLDSSGPRRGPCNSRWMIQENLPGRIEQ